MATRKDVVKVIAGVSFYAGLLVFISIAAITAWTYFFSDSYDRTWQIFLGEYAFVFLIVGVGCLLVVRFFNGLAPKANNKKR